MFCVLCVVQVEESVVAGKLLLSSMRRLRPAWHYELKDLLDMEMVRDALHPSWMLKTHSIGLAARSSGLKHMAYIITCMRC